MIDQNGVFSDGKIRYQSFPITILRDVRHAEVRDLPGWITFSIDGKTAWSSSGEVIDAKTKKVVALLKDDQGHDFQSEKMLEVVLDGTKVARTGDQFGVGEKR